MPPLASRKLKSGARGTAGFVKPIDFSNSSTEPVPLAACAKEETGKSIAQARKIATAVAALPILLTVGLPLAICIIFFYLIADILSNEAISRRRRIDTSFLHRLL